MNTNWHSRAVLIDFEPPFRSQREKRREAIQEHRKGDGWPVRLSPRLSGVKP